MISVIIPVGPNDSHIDFCLNSIAKSTFKALEVIVVLDGWKRAFNISRDINLLVFETEKSGPAACRNYGALKAKFEILCFLDADVEVHPDTLNTAFDFLSNSNVDGVIGSYDDTPHHPQIVSKFRNLLHHHHHQLNHLKGGAFWGAFGMIKKKVFFDIGMFNAEYKKPSIEDIELGYRLLNKEYKININAELLIKHRKKWTLKSMIITDILLRAKPWTQLLLLFPTKPKILNINAKEKLSAAIALVCTIFLVVGVAYPLFIGFSFLGLIIFMSLQNRFYNLVLNQFTLSQSFLIPILHFTYYWCAFTGMVLGHAENYLKKKK